MPYRVDIKNPQGILISSITYPSRRIAAEIVETMKGTKTRDKDRRIYTVVVTKTV